MTMNSNLFISKVWIDHQPESFKYYMEIPSIHRLISNPLIIDSGVTFFVGDNGAGKSTLIEAIAVYMGFNPEGGTKNYNFSTKDTHSDLNEYLCISRKNHNRFGYFLRAESFYNVATKEKEYFGILSKEYHAQSHGESFLALTKEFVPNGLYILDEPEAALSPTKLMQLLCIIHDLENKGSQFIIATHSPILMSYPNASIYEFSDKGINLVNYKDTEHYFITKEFLDNPDKMYEYLFSK